jgi:high affinity choline transporter 7
VTAAVVVALYASFLLVGWRAAQKVRSGGAVDLILAGRAMPLWIATLTMTATWVDGGYLLGTVEGTYRSSLASGIQGGLCFGISLILGGLFFARRMRALEFTTLIDPFETRFGAGWAVVLLVPAILAELFWSAELLVAIGSTFGVVLDMKLTTAIILSAAVVTLYTVAGGIWSVAYTDILQLGLVAAGLGLALPFALEASGGLDQAVQQYWQARPDRSGLLPPLAGNGSFWTPQAIAGWWDTSIMLVLGGIPWNCYFQRVLSCMTPVRAQWHSILAGLLTIGLTLPPLLMGIAAFGYAWPAGLAATLAEQPAQALPMLLRYATPALVGIVGLAAIVGAVTSSFSASILSAGSMFAWNCCRRALRPDLSAAAMVRVLRVSILLLGAGAAVMALEIRSVQELWFFTSDLVFVLLFPQLLYALFDPKVNLVGSIAAFAVSFLLRLGGGEPLLALPPLVRYPELLAEFLPGDPASWYDAASGKMLFPFKLMAAGAGLVILPIVSRLTARWSPPRPLRRLEGSV